MATPNSLALLDPPDDLFFEKLVDDLFLDFLPDVSVEDKIETTTTSNVSASFVPVESVKEESASPFWSTNDEEFSSYPAPAPLVIPGFENASEELLSPIPITPFCVDSNVTGRKRDTRDFTEMGGCEEDDGARSVTKKMAMTNVDGKDSWKMYKGVTYQPNSGRFRARIKIGTKTTHLGYFSTAIEAAVAYDRAAIQLRGDRAVLNFAGCSNNQMMMNDGCLSPKSRCVAAARTAVGTDALFQQPMLN